MSRKKDNFNQAMFEMFGVGKSAEKVQGTAAPAPAPEPEPEPEPQVPEKVIGFSNQKNDSPDLKVISSQPTYLAPGTRVEGTLRAEGSVEIDGEFRGDIIAEGSVTMRTDITGNITAKTLNVEGCCLTGDARITDQLLLNPDSAINGNVNTGLLTCSGTIIGDLNVQRNMSLDEKAKVVGNISTGSMTIAKGAVIRGNVETRGDESD